MNIYVGNISRDVSDNELQTLFLTFGQVDRVKIIRDQFTGESKGFGFVEMPSSTEAQNALNGLNSKDLKGRKIVVNEARPKTDGDRKGNDFSGRSFNTKKSW